MYLTYVFDIALQRKSFYFSSSFEGLLISYCISNPLYLPESFGGAESAQVKRCNSSILRPSTCHGVTQVMHLRQLAEPWGYFFLF